MACFDLELSTSDVVSWENGVQLLQVVCGLWLNL